MMNSDLQCSVSRNSTLKSAYLLSALRRRDFEVLDLVPSKLMWKTAKCAATPLISYTVRRRAGGFSARTVHDRSLKCQLLQANRIRPAVDHAIWEGSGCIQV